MTVPSTRQTAASRVVMRLPLALRVLAWLMTAFAVVLLAVAARLGAEGEATGAVVCAVTALVLVLVARLVHLPRVVLDEGGIHVRGLTGAKDLPWPTSREDWAVVTTRNGRGVEVATARLPAPDGATVTLRPLSRRAGSAREAAGRLDADLDRIWAWAQSRGYAWQTAPTVGTRTTWSDDARTPGGLPAPGHGPLGRRLSLVDPQLWSRPQLVFRAPRPLAVGLSSVLGVLTLAGGAFLATHPYLQAGATAGGRERALMGHGPVTVVIGLGGAGLGAVLLYAAWDVLRARTVVDLAGIHVRSGRGTVDLPWPGSRSDLAARIVRTQTSSRVQAVLVMPDGGYRVLRGVVRAGRGSSPEQALLTVLDTIWGWGAGHGATQETGRYTPMSAPEAEEERQRTERRFDHLASGGR